jgi:hypothetical protein
MMRPSSMRSFLILFLLASWLPLSGCVGTIVGTTVDVAVEVAKIPFKIGGAVVDVVAGDDDEETENKE